MGREQAAKTIAQHVQADRAEIYRALIKLEKIGLIQRYITNPVTFKAAPITEAFSILLQQNAEKHNQIQTETKKFIKKFKEQNHEEPSPEDIEYSLTTGSKAESRQYLRDMRETQTTRDVIIDWKLGLQWTNRYFEASKQLLERGVKWRYIAQIREDEEMPQIIQTLMKTGSFEVKTTSTIPKAGIDIFDKKRLHIITIPKANLNDIIVLRIDDPAIIELAQDYFDLKWQTTTTPRWCKKNHQTKPS